MIIKRLTFFFTVVVILNACGGKTIAPTKPNMTGRIGEIIVVSSKDIWNSNIGDSLRGNFSSAFPVLPQPEPSFVLMNVVLGNFKGLFETHRNVIMLQKSEQTKITIQNEKYSKGQVIIKYYYKNKEEFLSHFQKNSHYLLEFFNEKERERMAHVYKQRKNTKASKKLIEKHKIDITVPDNFKLDTDTNNFIWLSGDNNYRLIGVHIYHYPYVSKKQLSLNSLITKRNHMGMMYVPGGKEGSYMTTETIIPPTFDSFYKGKKYYAEIRGLWKIENGDFMGGPFISLTTIDTINNRVVTAEGYVFAPNSEKRTYVRQLEAMVYSLKTLE